MTRRQTIRGDLAPSSTPVRPADEAAPAPQSAIVERVFENFLAELTKAGFDSHVTDRLQVALRSKGDFSPEAMKTALFGDDAI